VPIIVFGFPIDLEKLLLGVLDDLVDGLLLRVQG
jgi:hypothetical protein